MDDSRFRGPMVNAPESSQPPTPEKPFALRAAVYTAGFLLFILGLIPSIFYILGEIPFASWSFWGCAAAFWSGLRAALGVAVFAIGLSAYLFCSAWLIGLGRGPHVEFDPPKVFVASGPYLWVRNPVVITLLVTVAGEAIFLNSIGILVLLLIGLPLAHYQVTRIEEPRLRKRFGESYVEYCSRVNRWLPKLPAE